jgi:hypothetical protein
MEERYIKFYSKFNRRWRKLIRHPKTVSDGRVDLNSALKSKYYGRFSSNGFCFRNDGFCFRNSRGRSNSSTRKTYKNPEAKGNSRRGLQGRIMHQTNLLGDGGVDKGVYII